MSALTGDWQFIALSIKLPGTQKFKRWLHKFFCWCFSNCFLFDGRYLPHCQHLFYYECHEVQKNCDMVVECTVCSLKKNNLNLHMSSFLPWTWSSCDWVVILYIYDKFQVYWTEKLFLNHLNIFSISLLIIISWFF